jgi:4-hydroxy-3-polyprenylbenzoate decarboxylase
MYIVRIIVGITGATGVIFGIRVLSVLKQCGVETHLILSKWAETTIRLETNYTVHEVMDMASVVYSPTNLAAPIASGSYPTAGMIVAPCSMKTLAAIRTGYTDNLISRAADVVLKERKKLVLLARETPLSQVHLENMLALTQAGAVILPPVPAFYNRPSSLEDVIDHIVMRTLDQFDLGVTLTRRWAMPNRETNRIVD